jgi:hypothetical protein
VAGLFSRFVATTPHQLTVYLHFPCFDGVVSAALTSEVLRSRSGLHLNALVPVTYDLRRNWIQTRLQKPAAIVDFLFHPEADFWADHHATSFVTKALEEQFLTSKGRQFLYDSSAKSCVSVIWKNCANLLSNHTDFEDLVTWANKIDSAEYDSVQEAILGDSPALNINRSLTINPDANYCEFLVRSISSRGLSQTARHPEVLKRSDKAQKKIWRGLKIAKSNIQLIDDIALLKIGSQPNAIISRYSPYYFHPEVRYSITCLELPEGTKITAMRNPWMDFESIPLGTVLEKFGGGGHRRVGSVFLSRNQNGIADSVVSSLISAMHNESQPVPVQQGALV